MGIWKATEEVIGALDDNLAGHISTVGTENSKSLDNSFDSFRRARAPSIYDQGSQRASLGVWVRQGNTGSASQKARDWQLQVVIDYTYRDQDRTGVAEQVELVTDAIMRTIDDMVARATIVGSGEEEGGTVAVHDIDQLVQEGAGIGGSGPYVAATRIEFPLMQREVLP